MFEKLAYMAFAALTAILITSCGTSTESRYGKESEKEEKEEVKTDTKIEKPFDMTPYHATIDFDIRRERTKEYDIWYQFDSSAVSDSGTGFYRISGFRVEVLAADNLEEAEIMKSDIQFKTRSEVYIIFDPPFYRVRTGDFERRNDADNLSFKLRQLGYPESRTVSDTIKVRGGR